ncbi:uncharacterized protein CFAP97D2 isoform X2 [Microcaecilia unicolor]|uniref:Uncharacterized protein CFAP97D2 isoform X2 n=1 Tax=Microcaecilia unicolor TaxID=1415580 RepID=A0A6P7XQQ0_9AMPH|nr:uncharacterized protein CFAP97D2 isoform X2 [Microcaecilia unicolor]
MHRSYQSILPCSNKYLQQKWDKAYYNEHKKKLEKDRLAVIERDNLLLLEKMSCIMRTTGRVDNKNDYEIKSLNKEKREQELLRVSRENQAILNRLMKCEPQYQVQKWQEDWEKAERYMDSIARYPRGWYNIQQGKNKPKGQKRASKKRESKKAMQYKAESVAGTPEAEDTTEYREDTQSKSESERASKTEFKPSKKVKALNANNKQMESKKAK